jgi:hypothetical protein
MAGRARKRGRIFRVGRMEIRGTGVGDRLGMH